MVTPEPLPLAIIMPPLPEKVAGNSLPVVCAAEPAYRRVYAVPDVNILVLAVTVPLPSIERMPVTTTLVVVFTPLPESVSLLYVVGFTVCAAPL